MPKNQKAVDAAKPNQNDRFFNRFLLALVVGCVAVFLLRGVQKYYSYIEYMDTIRTAAGWASVLALVLGAVGLLAAMATGRRAAVWTGGMLMLLGGCAGCIHLYYTDGVGMAYALVIGACALYVLKQIYANEYVALTGLSGLAAVAYYAISKYGGGRMWNSYTIPAAIALAVVLVLMLALTAGSGRGEGTVVLGKWRFLLWQARSSRVLLYLVCLIWAALLGLVFALGATFAWYCVWVVCAAIFALTVWFTIKLM